jgi:hypothetical protein
MTSCRTRAPPRRVVTGNLRPGGRAVKRRCGRSLRTRATPIAKLQNASVNAMGQQRRWNDGRNPPQSFHRLVYEFYVPYAGLGRRIRSGDTDPIRVGLTLLKADPWCFRSGYLKAQVLSASPISRLTRI